MKTAPGNLPEQTRSLVSGDSTLIKYSKSAAGKLNILFFIISLILIVVLVLLAGPERILGSLLSADPVFLAMALPFAMVPFLIRIAKTTVYFRRFGIFSGIRKSASFTFALNLLGSVTPFRSGELTASLSVPGRKRKKTLSIIIIDRFLEMLASLILILGSSVFIRGFAGFSSLTIILLIGILVSVFIFIAVFGERLWGFRRHFRSLSPGFIAAVFLMALAASISEGLFLYFIFRAFSLDVTVQMAIFVQHSANVIAVLASLPGGLGSREVYLMAVLSGMGLSASAALSSEFLYKVIVWLILIPAGAYGMFHLKRGVREESEAPHENDA